MNEKWTIDGREYSAVKLLGHGKGGYSYLALHEGKPFVVKQIHHEPCDYYHFGDKMEAELRDYRRLRDAGIRVPALIAWDREAERLVKEYVEGDTVFEYVRRGDDAEPFLPQARDMAEKARAAGLNIDYFPTNFVVQNGVIWYIDYECNAYMEEWSFENWGVRYWSMTPEFRQYLAERGIEG